MMPRFQRWRCGAPAPLLPRSHVVERMDGKTGSRRALRARAGSRRGRRGRPVLQEPVLGAADGQRRNCPGVRGVLFEVPEASMSAAAAMRLTQLHAEPKSTLFAHRLCRNPDVLGAQTPAERRTGGAVTVSTALA